MAIAFVVIASSFYAITPPELAEDRAEGQSGHRDQDGAIRAAAIQEGEFKLNPSVSRWRLDLNHLTTLSVESAEALVQRRAGTILLNGLTSISAQQAEALAKHRGRCLSLQGVQTLSEEAAAQLANYRVALWIDQAVHPRGPCVGQSQNARALAQRPDGTIGR
jgi:hypothetical protein